MPKQRYCIVCGQTSTSSVHIFPVPQDEKERQKWILSLKVFLPRTGQVCSKHFLPHCLGKKKILKGALPVKKFVPITPARSDDFEVIEPYNGTPTATKGRYRYNMLKKSSNNIVTWMCVKNETEQCEGRLTSKFGIVLKQFRHTCNGSGSATSSKEHCDNDNEKDITRENETIPVEIPNGKEGLTKSVQLTSIDFKRPSSCEIAIGKKIPNQLEPDIAAAVESSTENLHEDLLDYDLDIERSFDEITDPDTEKSSSNGDQVICRLCLEPNDRKTVTHLTLSEVDSRDKEDNLKKIRAMENAMFTNMIETLLPNFDLGMTCEPVMCTKCRALLISAYNFVEKCSHNENMIYLYKSELAPDKDKVFCEDVVQNLPLLMREDPPRKKLKTEPCESDESENSEQIPSYNISQSSLGETSSEQPSDISREIIEEPSTVVDEETVAEDFSSDFDDTSICEDDSRLETTSLLENEEPSLSERSSNKRSISDKGSVTTYFFNKSFKVTKPSSSSYIVVLPKEDSNVDVNQT